MLYKMIIVFILMSPIRHLNIDRAILFLTYNLISDLEYLS